MMESPGAASEMACPMVLHAVVAEVQSLLSFPFCLLTYHVVAKAACAMAKNEAISRSLTCVVLIYLPPSLDWAARPRVPILWWNAGVSGGWVAGLASIALRGRNRLGYEDAFRWLFGISDGVPNHCELEPACRVAETAPNPTLMRSGRRGTWPN